LLESPTARDAAVVISLLLVSVLGLWHPFQQSINSVINSRQSGFPVVIIEIVLDTVPSQEVTINGYHVTYKYLDGEGYHLVFIVPANKTYVLSPSCCSRFRYLSPKKYYAFWLGGCVAIRTDK
jgi:hypothetical protein